MWEFTAVHYDSDDPISFLLGVGSLAPHVLAVFLCCAVILLPAQRWHLDLLFTLFLSDLANFGLKRTLQQPRPTPRLSDLWSAPPRTDYGMPSRHAQFVACFFFWVWLQHGLRKATLKRALALIAVIAVALSRALTMSITRSGRSLWGWPSARRQRSFSTKPTCAQNLLSSLPQLCIT